jgi:hypothetical protein
VPRPPPRLCKWSSRFLDTCLYRFLAAELLEKHTVRTRTLHIAPMSPHLPKHCPEKVTLLNDFYVTTVLLSLLTDKLAQMRDTTTPEFAHALQSVREARASAEAIRESVESHDAICGCGTRVPR